MLLGLAVLTGGTDGCCPSLGAPSVHQQPHRDLVFASWVCSAFVSGSDPSFCWGHWHQPCCPVSAPQAAFRSCSLNPGLPQHWENSASEDSAEGCHLWLLHLYPPWSTASARHLELIAVLQEHTTLSCEMEEGALVTGRAAATYSDVAAPVAPVLFTEWALVSQIMSYLQARRTPLKHFIVGCKS